MVAAVAEIHAMLGTVQRCIAAREVRRFVQLPAIIGAALLAAGSPRAPPQLEPSSADAEQPSPAVEAAAVELAAAEAMAALQHQAAAAAATEQAATAEAAATEQAAEGMAAAQQQAAAAVSAAMQALHQQQPGPSRRATHKGKEHMDTLVRGLRARRKAAHTVAAQAGMRLQALALLQRMQDSEAELLDQLMAMAKDGPSNSRHRANRIAPE
jgi:hypothetical protein